jgi:flagella basal body P-ring formation protein FlgA
MPAHAAWQTPNVATPQMAVAQATMPAPASSAYFNITADDVEKAVATQLQLQAVETKAEVSLSAGSPNVLYSANHPLKVVVQALQIDTNSRRWQAQAYILSGNKTETVRPISGTYIALIDVPVLTRQLGRTDVIEATDLTMRAMPDRLIRKDTVTDPKLLIGQSPRAIISINRPIRQMEVSSPVVVKKGSPVQLTYSSQYMSIKTTGVALQDGALGEMIRVKNDKSEKAVSGRVAATGRVEVNTTPAL